METRSFASFVSSRLSRSQRRSVANVNLPANVRSSYGGGAHGGILIAIVNWSGAEFSRSHPTTTRDGDDDGDDGNGERGRWIFRRYMARLSSRFSYKNRRPSRKFPGERRVRPVLALLPFHRARAACSPLHRSGPVTAHISEMDDGGKARGGRRRETQDARRGTRDAGARNRSLSENCARTKTERPGSNSNDSASPAEPSRLTFISVTYTDPIFYPGSRVNSVSRPALSPSLPRLVALIVPRTRAHNSVGTVSWVAVGSEIFVTKRDERLHES